LNISDVSDSKFELIGPDMDEILDAINFINENYKGVKLIPMDWSLLVSDNYSIFVKFEPEANFISTSAKNIQINGNENSIGSGAQNVNITSGDGNFVTGGEHMRFMNDLLSENEHMGFMNDLLSENDFKCKLYKTK